MRLYLYLCTIDADEFEADDSLWEDQLRLKCAGNHRVIGEYLFKNLLSIAFEPCWYVLKDEKGNTLDYRTLEIIDPVEMSDTPAEDWEMDDEDL